MGHDHQQSSSSGTLVAVIGVGLALAILGIVVVAAVGLFWVRAARMESLTAVVAEQRAIAELHRAEAEAQHAVAIAQLEQARTAATPDPRLDFQLDLDREGNASADGEKIGLDDLRTQLAKLKDETSDAFSVQINADPECPVKHVIPVLEVCKEVGDIDFSVALSSSSDSSDEGGDANAN